MAMRFREAGTCEDLVSYTSAQYDNGLPYQTRAVDLALSYNFPLNRAFESLPGSLSMSLRATRALEASGIQNLSTFGAAPATDPCAAKLERADRQNYDLDGDFRVINQYRCVDLVGQIQEQHVHSWCGGHAQLARQPQPVVPGWQPHGHPRRRIHRWCGDRQAVHG